MTPSIAMNTLARRHTADSPRSHFVGTEESLLSLVGQCFDRASVGIKLENRPGVLSVPVPAGDFRCGFVVATDRVGLSADWVVRRPGEDPFIQFSALGGSKPVARRAEVVLYAHDVLGVEASTHADWEVVALNAWGLAGDEPKNPVVMARNHRGRPGGTAAKYTFDEFVAALLYWGRRVSPGPLYDPVSGPAYPPLIAGLASPATGEPYVLAHADDTSFLPEPPQPEPPLPILVARCAAGLESNPRGMTRDADALAAAIGYWAGRPRPQLPLRGGT